MKAEICVILPVYNGGDLLEQSIRSVLKQDFENFEFLICDDCSTDNSYERIVNLVQHLNFVKIYRNERNLGLFKTLNKLIHESTAPLIHLWSQDDVMKPHCLSSTLTFHRRYPSISMSYSGRDIIDQTGKVLQLNKRDGTPDIIPKELYAKTSCYWGCMPGNIANVTLVRDVLNQTDLFREDMSVSGDFELWTRLVQHAPIGFNRDANIFLREHTNQLSRQYISMLYRIEEDILIMQSLLTMVSAADTKKVLRCWKWKTQTMYFNELVFLFYKKQYMLSRSGFRLLSEIAFLPALCYRWLLIKIFRVLRIEMWFYRKVLKTLN
ncbi:glycosyltransferase family 2 protein (plasmid) [Pedobacter sp. BS3]|uniref:glycosyltransferase family A protein n=1 Tax=Pedobacter sp. BS3 TaxID=2567937 RepID=UPI0011EF7E56|nr:glycosyltransferase family 2 protein [Pedobacter sp. BS3]TZF86214.1 glycosyltransferase family 2 protein [Pedobacter sp. BS3]